MKYRIRKTKTGYKLTILTFFLLALIVATSGMVRLYYKKFDLTNSMQVIAIDYKADHYITKNSILILLEDEMKQKEFLHHSNSTYYIYLSKLQKYLSDSNVYLSTEECTQIYEKINELLNIVNIEDKKDFTSMSLAGEAVALGIADKIYELCGLKLTVGLGGNIDKITDRSGTVIYGYDKGYPSYDFKVYPLIITFSVIIILMAILLIIFNKNYLLKKEADFDKFKKKRYA